MELDKTRKKKLMLNSVTSLANQITALICGFILPKLILSTFGSNVNGLVTSINQFLNVITFLDLGVGAVVTSALYRPLAMKDYNEIGQIYLSAKRFFNKIAIVFLGYIAVLVFVYPKYIATGFGFVYTSSLILVISITLFSQYYFGIVNQLLLNADQKTYIVMLIQCSTLVLNTVACAFMMKAGVSIQMVKLTTSVIFLARPALLTCYVKKNYRLNLSQRVAGEPIRQKWNGLAQHLAHVVLTNTDSIVLTMFSTLQNVSIYGVYNLVVNGVKTIFSSLTAGMSALFGNMLAKNETELLNQTFSDFEWLIHTATTLIYTICGLMIVPFVAVYTKGINDANYIVPLFASIITMANAVYCLRVPYNMVVLAAGHYRQTQMSSIIEMLINIIVSILAVSTFGLVGVAVGTLCAMAYRTIYLAFYLSHHILKRKLRHFLKHCCVDVISVILMIIATSWMQKMSGTYIEWIFKSMIVSGICFIIVYAVNYIVYKEKILKEIDRFMGRVKRKKHENN